MYDDIIIIIVICVPETRSWGLNFYYDITQVQYGRFARVFRKKNFFKKQIGGTDQASAVRLIEFFILTNFSLLRFDHFYNVALWDRDLRSEV